MKSRINYAGLFMVVFTFWIAFLGGYQTLRSIYKSPIYRDIPRLIVQGISGVSGANNTNPPAVTFTVHVPATPSARPTNTTVPTRIVYAPTIQAETSKLATSVAMQPTAISMTELKATADAMRTPVPILEDKDDINYTHLRSDNDGRDWAVHQVPRDDGQWMNCLFLYNSELPRRICFDPGTHPSRQQVLRELDGMIEDDTYGEPINSFG